MSTFVGRYKQSKSIIMKKTALLITIVLMGFAANAQYKQAIGLRFGLPSGLSYKTFTSEKKCH